MSDSETDAWPAGKTATMNVTYTQANAAGGAVVCEISPGAGNEFVVFGAHAINSGTNGVNMLVETATGGAAIQLHAIVASGAGTAAYLGGTSTGAGAVQTQIFPGILVSGTQAFKIFQTGAGAQNDTFQVLVNIRTRGGLPTVTHANSTNAANVSVTAGTEAFTTV